MKAVLCIVLSCVICSAQTQPPQKPNKNMSGFLQQLADTRKTIANGYVQWTEAAKTGDLDALVGMYTNDATMLPDENEAASGKDAIRAFYKGWIVQRGKLVDQKFENISSVQEGDLLIDTTQFSGVVNKDGKEIAFKGKRLVVWKREFQGPWKILRDMWNRSPVD